MNRNKYRKDCIHTYIAKQILWAFQHFKKGCYMIMVAVRSVFTLIIQENDPTTFILRNFTTSE